MRLYHGSNMIVDKPNLRFSRKELDFGIGFYTTTNYEQAAMFSEKIAARSNGDKIVNIYEFDGDILPKFNVLEFLEADMEWLDFVSANRNSSQPPGDYDIIIGPVANDDVFRTLLLYFADELNAEDTLSRLKIKKLFNQYVFKNDTVLKHLIFVKGEFL